MGVTSASCEQLGRPVDSLMLFTASKSRVGVPVVVAVCIMMTSPREGDRYQSIAYLQRLSRLVGQSFSAFRHMGLFS